MSQEVVSFCVIDFAPENASDILLEYLKNTLRKPLYQPFSCQFNRCGDLMNGSEITNRYKINISYRHNCLLVFTWNQILIFSRSTKALINTLTICETITTVLDENNDVIYILCRVDSTVRKYDLGMFVKSNGNESDNGLIWKRPSSDYPCKMALYNGKFQKYLLVLDNVYPDLKILDPKSGETINNFKITLDYWTNAILVVGDRLFVGLALKEMLIYQIVERPKHLKLIPHHNVKLNGLFQSITYCPVNKYIITDAEEGIAVLNGDNLQVIKIHKEKDVGGIFDFCLDKLSGELFVCYQMGLFVYR